jgi:hypothetical protein
MARIQSYALSSLNEGDKLLASDAVTGATKNVSPLDVAATVVGPNTIGNITWVRNSVGSYNGNLTGAFSGYVAIVMGVAPTSEFPADMSYSNTSNGITLLTYNSNGGSLTDGMLTQQYIEIRVYQV